MSFTADEDAAIDGALAVLRAGGLVAVPTETVYGLAANADDEHAVRRIFVAKGRPADHPLIVHVAGPTDVFAWCASMSPPAEVLAAACWPGPLTLLLPRAARVLDVVTGGRDTVGIRVPAHRLTTELLRRFGGGVAAPSANRFGRVSPTTAAHVRADLGDDVDLVLDGGPCPVGVESTIVDCSVEPPQVLRPGGIPTEQIEELLRGQLAVAHGPSRAAGMLTSHYAPACPVLLAESDDAVERLADVAAGRMVIGVGLTLPDYARQLYELLRNADRTRASAVVALLPPPVGLGHAIRDRLFKAAADRAG